MTFFDDENGKKPEAHEIKQKQLQTENRSGKKQPNKQTNEHTLLFILISLIFFECRCPTVIHKLDSQAQPHTFVGCQSSRHLYAANRRQTRQKSIDSTAFFFSRCGKSKMKTVTKRAK